MSSGGRPSTLVLGGRTRWTSESSGVGNGCDIATLVSWLAAATMPAPQATFPASISHGSAMKLAVGAAAKAICIPASPVVIMPATAMFYVLQGAADNSRVDTLFKRI